MSPGPYHVLPLSLLLILAYLGSWILVRFRAMDRHRHRKLWNGLLLAFFVTSALLGLFLALKVNYKWEIPRIDSYMQWHVDLGIGLAVTGLIHLTWHLSYYKGWPGSARSAHGSTGATALNFTPGQFRLLAFVLGFTGVISQLVLLREFLRILHGNELIIGWFLSTWMVLTAYGSLLGRRFKGRLQKSQVLGTLGLASLAPLLVCLILLPVQRLLLLPGTVPSLWSGAVLMLVCALPAALPSGFLFAFVSRAGGEKANGRSLYAMDSLGGGFGGLLFGLGLVFVLDDVQILALLPVLVTGSLALGFGFPRVGWKRVLLPAAGFLVFLLSMHPGIRSGMEQIRFQGERVLAVRDTPFGNLARTDRQGQITLYQDGRPLPSGHDVAWRETLVHFASLQGDPPKSFLLIGGTGSGLPDEIWKYAPERFDGCMVNPWMDRLSGTVLPPSAKEPDPTGMDARRWLNRRPDSLLYDVVISVPGDPATLSWNRYFTREFYALVAESLGPAGVFCMQLGVGGNYINDAGSSALNTNYQTLKSVFTNVELLPLQGTVFLASQSPIRVDVAGEAERRSLDLSYVTGAYIDPFQLDFDREQLMSRIAEEPVRINRDLDPLLFFQTLGFWLSMESRGSFRILIAAGAGLLLWILLRLPPRQGPMVTAGFAGAGLQILFILLAQTSSVFSQVTPPLLIGGFLTGLALGATVKWRKSAETFLTGLAASLGILLLAGILGVVLVRFRPANPGLLIGLLIPGLLNAFAGFGVGNVYRISWQHQSGTDPAAASALFSADLAGSALGNLLPPLVMLPLLGMSNTLILLCAMVLGTGTLTLVRNLKGR
ncbi:MAG: hypothetical protein R2751_13830 [Bacteroidales bacterium]